MWTNKEADFGGRCLIKQINSFRSPKRNKCMRLTDKVVVVQVHQVENRVRFQATAFCVMLA